MKYLLAFSLSLVVIIPWYALWQADEVVTQLEYDLNVSNTAIMVYKAENKRLTERNEDLEVANECLIKYSNRDRCITAIKHTPLPKLVKETK